MRERAFSTAVFLSAASFMAATSFLMARPLLAQSAAQQAGSQFVDSNEIIVTATRQAQALSRVPISVSAATQESLDTQSVRTIDDITRFTPGLTLSRNGFGTQSSISIRGISSNIGAGTVGIYIDDTPIQTRSIGYTSTNVYPRLFDLERLEVLRGPQGTLFGAGSEGGTLRFITPSPSLTTLSAYGRAEVATIDSGAQNYELGAAVGGPLIADKLGIRVSADFRRDGGWIDRVNQFTGEVYDKNGNSQDSFVGRAALLWEPVEGLQIMPSVLYQNTKLHDVYTYWDAISDPSKQQFRNGQIMRQPDRDQYVLPALRIEYDGAGFDVISNTSWFSRTHKALDDYTNLMFGLWANANTLPELPDYKSWADMQNYYKSFTQEVRIQSSNSDSRFTWVVGAFYSKLKQHAYEQISDPDLEDLYQDVLGHGVLAESGMNLIDGLYSLVAEFHTTDEQLAGFGEVTYELFDGLRAIVGLRYSHSKFRANDYNSGPWVYGTIVDEGAGSENPITPKFGLSWQADENNLFYATVAKGFRVGGVNPVIPLPPCAADFDARGYTDGSPPTYGADSLWSYEAGAKNRFFGGATQLATSIFHIKWDNIQRNVYLPGCAMQFTDNLGVAVSNGFDVALNQRLFEGFTIDFQASYTDSKFDKDIYGRLDRLPQVRKGNALQTQPWTVVFGAEYRRPIGPADGYARLDYNYRGGRKLTAGLDPTTSSYDPNTFAAQATNNVNVRVGAAFSGLDISAFINNLTNAHPALTHYAEGGDPIFRETTLTPRTIGLSATYRY